VTTTTRQEHVNWAANTTNTPGVIGSGQFAAHVDGMSAGKVCKTSDAWEPGELAWQTQAQ